MYVMYYLYTSYTYCVFLAGLLTCNLYWWRLYCYTRSMYVVLMADLYTSTCTQESGPRAECFKCIMILLTCILYSILYNVHCKMYMCVVLPWVVYTVHSRAVGIHSTLLGAYFLPITSIMNVLFCITQTHDRKLNELYISPPLPLSISYF